MKENKDKNKWEKEGDITENKVNSNENKSSI